MKKKLTALLLAVFLLAVPSADYAAADVPTEQEAYESMVALREKYPEGTPWTNSNRYTSRAPATMGGGGGCHAFALILSDAAFGALPGRKIGGEDFDFDALRVGDIIRVGGYHSVIVLERYSDHIVIAEGNYNNSVHWGRELTREMLNGTITVKDGMTGEPYEADYVTFVMTRYPAEGGTAAEEEPAVTAWAVTEDGTPIQVTVTVEVHPVRIEDVTDAEPTEPETIPVDAEPVEPDAEPVEPDAEPIQAETAAGFTDVPADAWYAEAVAWAVKAGVTNGVTPDTFAPENTCTRGQVVTFLWRANGSPAPKGTANPFTDVSASSAFYKAILWAVENGITAGTSADTFSPSAPCTRAHVVTFLWRSLGSPGASIEETLAEGMPEAYYRPAVAWADSLHLLDTPDGTFVPGEACPRSDIAAYLYRASRA